MPILDNNKLLYSAKIAKIWSLLDDYKKFYKFKTAFGIVFRRIAFENTRQL
jgi:hypothetical protein